MAYSEDLAERIRTAFQQRDLLVEEKKMMGGLCFMLDDKMCVGVVKDQLMARIGLDSYESALQEPGVHEMNFTGRAMKGYVFIDGDAHEQDRVLNKYIDLSVAFNPLAKSSKKKKKKTS